jgi:ribulose-bisphosphate carboxylase large chain
MRVLAKILRAIGVDQLHVGTAVGKMSEKRGEVMENCVALVEEIDGFKKVLPVASGGLHPALVPSLIDIFGKDFAIQAGGGIHGHQRGTQSGAKAMKQAVTAVMEDISLEEYAKTHIELSAALNTWKT